jgi:hypothetical protein
VPVLSVVLALLLAFVLPAERGAQTDLARPIGPNVGTTEAPQAAALPPVGVWQSMFDGVSLKGWKETPFTAHGKVRIEKGTIILETGYMTGITWTGPFPPMDYEVRGGSGAAADEPCAAGRAA